VSRDEHIGRIRFDWAVRTYGAAPFSEWGSPRRDGQGSRIFYGPNYEAKALRDIEAHGAVIEVGEDGHAAEALRLQRAQQLATVDPARDCPPCPACSMPCGSTNGETDGDFLECLACGESWRGTADELAQARRADAAYEAQLQAEEVAAAHEASLPAKLREVNRRMLEQLEARRAAPECEQLSLLGGEP
jgi:hypothetical protein